MNLKIYEKTRWENIYRHKKNKNYIIRLRNPNTTISTIDGNKIYDYEIAKGIRDNAKIIKQKEAEIKYKDKFDDLWDKYMFFCKYDDKQAYNTYHKKELIYFKYLKGIFTKSLSKYRREDFINYVEKLDTTIVMKNHIIKHLRTFLNWCVSHDYLTSNPIRNIKMYKTQKKEMKYWLPEEITKFFKYLNKKILEEDVDAYRIKIFVLLCFTLGDRVGETRALMFENINCANNTIYIKHSIDYDTSNKNFVSDTKTYESMRTVDISENVILEIKKYKDFLIKLGYSITDKTLLFFNHDRNRPISDSKLRKDFYKYSEEAKCRKIRMYDLRHTYATTMMAEGKDPYTFSKRMGHKSIKTTIDVYGHISEKTRKEIAKTTDKYIF